jgi:hypothetical protein
VVDARSPRVSGGSLIFCGGCSTLRTLCSYGVRPVCAR